jgi:hypothetical protein
MTTINKTRNEEDYKKRRTKFVRPIYQSSWGDTICIMGIWGVVFVLCWNDKWKKKTPIITKWYKNMRRIKSYFISWQS